MSYPRVTVRPQDAFPPEDTEPVYVLPFRGGEVTFAEMNAGEWEVHCFGADGTPRWNTADPLLNSLTFSQARREAREHWAWCEEMLT